MPETENSPETAQPTETQDKADAIEAVPVPPGLPPELEQKLPPDVRRELMVFLSSHQRIGMPVNPIAEKVTPEHITKVIDNAEKESQRKFKGKWFTLAYSVLALAFLVFVFIYLPSVDKALFMDVLKILLTFLGGLGTGFGIAKFRGDD